MFELLIEHRAWMLKSLGPLQTRSLPLHYRGDQLLGADWWGRKGRSSRSLKKRSRSLKTRSRSLKKKSRKPIVKNDATVSSLLNKLPGLRCGNPKYSTFFPSFFGWALFLWFSPLIILKPNRLHCRTTTPSLGELLSVIFGHHALNATTEPFTLSNNGDCDGGQVHSFNGFMAWFTLHIQKRSVLFLYSK